MKIHPTALYRTTSQLLTKNSPAILTAFGAVGVVATAVLTARATFEAADRINLETAKLNYEARAGDQRIEMETFDKVKLVAPLYIEPFVSGVLSCGAIIMSHRISSRRAAVIAAAYALNEGKLEEYKDKVKEKFGEKKADEVRQEIHQDRINAHYDGEQVLFSPLDGLVQIREEYTGRVFWSSVENINKAVNEINAQINRAGYAKIVDFYKCIGLPEVSVSRYFGWTQAEPLAIAWDTCTTPDGKTAIHTFEYENHPVMGPERDAPFR